MNFLIWIVSLFVFTLIHEFGHIIFLRLAGGTKDWRIEIGAGTPIVKLKKITINSAFFFGGRVENIDFHKRPSKIGLLFLNAGGGLLNIVFVVLLHFVLLPLAYESATLPELIFRILRIARDANIIMTLLFLLPIRIPRIGPSDGFLILTLLRSKNAEEYYKKISAYFEENTNSD